MEYVLFAALIWQVVDFFRELRNLPGSKSGVMTQALSWTAGIVLIALASQAAITADVTLPGITIPVGDYDGWSIVLAGMIASSLASTGVDIKQAIDGNDSAAKPPLLH